VAHLAVNIINLSYLLEEINVNNMLLPVVVGD
jgi:hypothetical protein